MAPAPPVTTSDNAPVNPEAQAWQPVDSVGKAPGPVPECTPAAGRATRMSDRPREGAPYATKANSVRTRAWDHRIGAGEERMTTGARRAHPNRQARQRAATYDAMVNAARTLLAEGQDLTLRGVAAAMGASPAGLYRYVANLDELLDLVAASIDESMTADLVAAVEAVEANDATTRWLVAWVRLRRWALSHPDEFRLVLARPRSDETSIREVSDAYLGECLRALTTHHDVRMPPVPPAAESTIAGLAQRPGSAPWPTALTWLHTRVLASLHGVVALEVTGYLDPALVANAVVFRATMIEWLARLVRADDLGALLAALDGELVR